MAQPLLDDALWARLEPLLPKPRRRARRPRVSERAALTGIVFVLRGGPFAMNATTASITPSSRWGAR